MGFALWSSTYPSDEAELLAKVDDDDELLVVVGILLVVVIVVAVESHAVKITTSSGDIFYFCIGFCINYGNIWVVRVNG